MIAMEDDLDRWEARKAQEATEQTQFSVPQSIYLSWIRRLLGVLGASGDSDGEANPSCTRQELDDEQACMELPFMILKLSFNSETEGSRECSASKGGDFIHLDGGFLAASWAKIRLSTSRRSCGGKLLARFWR